MSMSKSPVAIRRLHERRETMELTANLNVNEIASPSNKAAWTGRVLSGLAVLFFLFDSAAKLARSAPSLKGTVELGFPESAVVPIGIILLACTVVYLIPRASIVGAVLLTGYLGGAVAAQLRAGNPLASHTLFPIYVAVLVWGGLYLRDERVRALLARRRRSH
jgi:hypothetical protein